MADLSPDVLVATARVEADLSNARSPVAAAAAPSVSDIRGPSSTSGSSMVPGHHHAEGSTSSMTGDSDAGATKIVSPGDVVPSRLLADTDTSDNGWYSVGGENRRVIVRHRTCGANNKWGKWQDKYFAKKEEDYDSTQKYNSRPPLIIQCSRGGTVRLYPNVMPCPIARENLVKEVMKPGYMRKYRIQAGWEPRVHFLAHAKATDDFDAKQPGYRYGTVTMKSYPLENFPLLQDLSDNMETLSRSSQTNNNSAQLQTGNEDTNGKKPPHFNIGVESVLYRDGNDKINKHADNSQNEEVVLAVLVSSPPNARPIRIEPQTKEYRGRVAQPLQHGDEQYELLLQAGDGYEMDGELQNHYLHSVPIDKEQIKTPDSNRIAIVCRRGEQKDFERDSGYVVDAADLAPRNVEVIYRHGNGENFVPELEEGQYYSKLQLFELRAHRQIQKGVSGNQVQGCDAISVAGKREDGLGMDGLIYVWYWCTTLEGALSVITSAEDGLPIRVFRLHSSWTAEGVTPPAADSGNYRYDGIYMVAHVTRVWRPSTGSNKDENKPKQSADGSEAGEYVYGFLMTRIEKGTGKFSNRLAIEELISVICSEASSARKKELSDEVKSQAVRVLSAEAWHQSPKSKLVPEVNVRAEERVHDTSLDELLSEWRVGSAVGANKRTKKSAAKKVRSRAQEEKESPKGGTQAETKKHTGGRKKRARHNEDKNQNGGAQNTATLPLDPSTSSSTPTQSKKAKRRRHSDATPSSASRIVTSGDYQRCSDRLWKKQSRPGLG